MHRAVLAMGWRWSWGVSGWVFLNRLRPTFLEDGPDALQLFEVFSLRWGDMQPLRVSTNFPATAMTLSSVVMSGLVIYLCLWNTVAEIRVALLFSIHIIHER